MSAFSLGNILAVLDSNCTHTHFTKRAKFDVANESSLHDSPSGFHGRTCDWGRAEMFQLELFYSVGSAYIPYRYDARLTPSGIAPTLTMCEAPLTVPSLALPDSPSVTDSPVSAAPIPRPPLARSPDTPAHDGRNVLKGQLCA
jgi:hypothetical protein